MRRMLRTLIFDKDGSVATLFAVAAPPLFGLTAIAIDLGSIYMAERDLQGIADAAAAAAVARPDIAEDASRIVAEVVAHSGQGGITVETVTPGTYTRDPAMALAERFAETDTDPNAVSVELTQSTPTLMGGVLFGKEASTVRVKAMAAKTNLVAFELNTKTLSLSGGVVNEYLSGLTGTTVTFSDDEIDAMLSEQIDILAFADALAERTPDAPETFGELFGETLPLGQVLQALADATTNPQLAGAIRQLAAGIAGGSVVLADVIDLGPYGALSDAGTNGSIQVEVYSLLRTVLQESNGPGYDISLAANALDGVAASKIMLSGGRGFERSPWMTITAARDVVLRTAQTRLYSEFTANLPGIGSLKIPLLLELAPAEAWLTGIDCDPASATNGVALETKPSVGTLALADIDESQFGDFSSDLWTGTATIMETPVSRLTVYGSVDAGGANVIPVRLSLDEVEAGVRKETGTQDLLATKMATLLQNLDVQAQVLGLGLGLGNNALPGQDAVTALIASLAPQLDALVNQATAVAGVKLGVAEVGVNRLSCGRPMVVG